MRDERAQMMLLTAVILLLGFVALAGMVARVSSLAEEVAQDRRHPLFDEADLLALGIEDAMDSLTTLVAPGAASATSGHMDAVDESMAQLELLELGRGYKMASSPAVCVDLGATQEILVAVYLASATGSVSFAVSNSHTGITCP